MISQFHTPPSEVPILLSNKYPHITHTKKSGYKAIINYTAIWLIFKLETANKLSNADWACALTKQYNFIADSSMCRLGVSRFPKTAVHSSHSPYTKTCSAIIQI